jgi:hypothetical protein
MGSSARSLRAVVDDTAGCTCRTIRGRTRTGTRLALAGIDNDTGAVDFARLAALSVKAGAGGTPKKLGAGHRDGPAR